MMTGKWRQVTDFPNLHGFFEVSFDEVWFELFKDQEEVIDDYRSQPGPESEAIANEAGLLVALATDGELCDTLRRHGIVFVLQHEGVAARACSLPFGIDSEKLQCLPLHSLVHRKSRPKNASVFDVAANRGQTSRALR